MARGIYRFRQCPECGTVLPAGKFTIVNYHGCHWHDRGGSMRRCPDCGHVDFTQAFKLAEGRIAQNSFCGR